MVRARFPYALPYLCGYRRTKLWCRLLLIENQWKGECPVNAISVVRRQLSLRTALLLAGLVVQLAATPHAAAAVSNCEARAARTHQTLVADSLDNWEPVNDRTVLIWLRHSTRAHLVKLDRPLDGLPEAAVVVLVDGDHDLSISACGKDGLAIGDGPGIGQIARIVSIRLLSEKRTAELDRGAHASLPDSMRV